MTQITETNENTTTENPPTLNLDAGVTPEEYRTCLERIVAAGAVIAARNGWCAGWLTYLMNLSPHYQRNGVIEIPEDDTLNREWFKEDMWAEYYAQFNTARATQLRDLRGRILTYVESSEVSLADANEVFTSAGLPTYEATEGQHGYALYIGGSTRSRRDTVSTLDREAYGTLVREQEQAFLAAVGYAAQDPSRGGFVTVESRRLPRVRAEERRELLYRA